MSKETVTINVFEQTYTVTGNYIKPFPGIMYHSDGSGSPPEPAEFEIELVEWHRDTGKEIDVTDLFFGMHENIRCNDLYDEFEELCCEVIENQDHEI